MNMIIVVTCRDRDGYYLPIFAAHDEEAADAGIAAFRDEHADNPHWLLDSIGKTTVQLIEACVNSAHR